ncbi:LemA family protein [Candidatus Micrarchaeota archaeon]|nr:LemA family protein [Candidatus Micrarchaeota archaeon]MBU1166701.1 LemA family protein [Candidatus Micrarchaeota archaeon]MBU1886126.1 LemA family protein [Candidatus Micrarchaeota archaeon]
MAALTLLPIIACVGFVFIVLGLLFLFYAVSIYNALIVLKNNLGKAWSNIDVLLKQRSDLIPNLVETVKGYMKHEQYTLEKITKLRSSIISYDSPGKIAKPSEAMSGLLKNLFMVSEKYPDLKANQNFLKLQEQLTAIENQIADRREFYNNSVLLYNTRIHSLPDSIVAMILGMKDNEYFKATTEEKELVKVDMSNESNKETVVK